MLISDGNSTEVVIIGGGPAGLSAALWCDELGLRSVLVEREKVFGGQLRHVYNPIKNYLGLSSANGKDMLSQFEKSVASRNFVRRTGITVASIDTRALKVTLSGSREEVLGALSIIIATGVRRRVLGVPGEICFRGKGIIESGTKDKHLLRGERVLIIGGGDAAFENALIVSEVAASVVIAYRRNTPAARSAFVEAARQVPNIKVLPGTVLSGILGDSCVETAELTDLSGRTWHEPIDAILIRIGVEPNSDFVRGVLDQDEAGYIKIDHTGQTSSANIYAVGDVANRTSPTLSTAAGTAATAVKSIFERMQNSKRL